MQNDRPRPKIAETGGHVDRAAEPPTAEDVGLTQEECEIAAGIWGDLVPCEVPARVRAGKERQIARLREEMRAAGYSVRRDHGDGGDCVVVSVERSIPRSVRACHACGRRTSLAIGVCTDTRPMVAMVRAVVQAITSGDMTAAASIGSPAHRRVRAAMALSDHVVAARPARLADLQAEYRSAVDACDGAASREGRP